MLQFEYFVFWPNIEMSTKINREILIKNYEFINLIVDSVIRRIRSIDFLYCFNFDYAIVIDFISSGIILISEYLLVPILQGGAP